MIVPLFGEEQPLLLVSSSDFKMAKVNGLFPSTVWSVKKVSLVNILFLKSGWWTFKADN